LHCSTCFKSGSNISPAGQSRISKAINIFQTWQTCLWLCRKVKENKSLVPSTTFVEHLWCLVNEEQFSFHSLVLWLPLGWEQANLPQGAGYWTIASIPLLPSSNEGLMHTSPTYLQPRHNSFTQWLRELNFLHIFMPVSRPQAAGRLFKYTKTGTRLLTGIHSTEAQGISCLRLFSSSPVF
jgi:hypothetical protein